MGSDSSQIFPKMNHVFSQVVTLAKSGQARRADGVPGSGPYQAVVQTAARLESSRIVMGLSPSSRLPAGRPGGPATGRQASRAAAFVSLEIVLENQERTLCSSTWAAFLRASGRGPRLSSPALAELERQGSGIQAASPATSSACLAPHRTPSALGPLRGVVDVRPARDLRRQHKEPQSSG